MTFRKFVRFHVKDQDKLVMKKELDSHFVKRAIIIVSLSRKEEVIMATNVKQCDCAYDAHLSKFDFSIQLD